MLEKKHLVFLAGATAPFAPPLCTALVSVEDVSKAPELQTRPNRRACSQAKSGRADES